MQMILELTNQSLDFTKSTSITQILQRLIGQLNNHLHNLQTINNGCYVTITVTVTVNKYHRPIWGAMPMVGGERGKSEVVWQVHPTHLWTDGHTPVKILPSLVLRTLVGSNGISEQLLSSKIITPFINH